MKALKKSINDFWRYRYLLWNLVSRDFKIKYRRSVLGVAWSVLNPLLMCVVYWAVFSSIFATMSNDPALGNFPVYLMIGQTLYVFFSESTSSSMGSIVYSSSLLKKVYIPKYIFPLEKCCFSLINCVFSFVGLALVMLITGCELQWTTIFAIYPLLMMFFFNLGISLFLSACTVYFRDIMHMWTVFTTALLYFSAVFYNPDTMLRGHVLFGAINFFGHQGIDLYYLICLNPLYWYITAFRKCVLWGELMSPLMIAICAGCAVISLIVGTLTFRKLQDNFVMHI